MKMHNTHCAVALEFALMLNEIYSAFICFFPLLLQVHNTEPTA